MYYFVDMRKSDFLNLVDVGQINQTKNENHNIPRYGQKLFFKHLSTLCIGRLSINHRMPQYRKLLL